MYSNLTIVLFVAAIILMTYNGITYGYLIGIACLIISTSLIANSSRFSNSPLLEHLQMSSEAIQNVGSIYNTDKMVIKDLEVTGNLTVTGPINANAVNASAIQAGSISGSTGTFSGNVTAPTATFASQVSTNTLAGENLVSTNGPIKVKSMLEMNSNNIGGVNSIYTDKIYSQSGKGFLHLGNAMVTMPQSAIIMDQAQLQVPSQYLYIDGQQMKLGLATGKTLRVA